MSDDDGSSDLLDLCARQGVAVRFRTRVSTSPALPPLSLAPPPPPVTCHLPLRLLHRSRAH
ncbi:hypothetical protein EXIGLDRAFT_721944, partial [Exidia glandulosa HHB12029]